MSYGDKKETSKHNTIAEMLSVIRYEAEALPSDFDNWMEDNIFIRYMYFTKVCGAYLGYCGCGADNIIIPKAKSGAMFICPKCGRSVKLKSNRYSHDTSERKIIAYLQETSMGWMQRLFVVYKHSVLSAETTPRVKCNYKVIEEQRDMLTYTGDYRKFHYTSYAKYNLGLNDPYGWVKGRGLMHGMGYGKWRAEDGFISTYPHNLNKLFESSEYKYSQLQTATEHLNVNPFLYLFEFEQFPQLEYLLKLKLYKLADNFLLSYSYNSENMKLINKYGKTLKEICGLETKQDITYAAENNLSASQVRVYNITKKWKAAHLTESIEFCEKLISRAGSDFQYSFISNEKLFAYYLTQKQQYTVSNFISDYSDYISAAIYLNMNVNDTKVKTPRDLKYVHDICIARQQELIEKERVKKKRAAAKSFKKISATYKKQFEYVSGKYQIVVPQTAKEIKQEGKKQGHCVGTYVDRVAEGRSIIVFLRKVSAPDAPFCTAEIQPSTLKLVQCRAKGNATPPADAQKWMERYIKRIQKQAEETANKVDKAA